MHSDMAQHSKCRKQDKGCLRALPDNLDGKRGSLFGVSMHKAWTRQSSPILALAPMDGYTDSAFRRICKKVNPDIVVFTEFTSIDGLHFAPVKARERFRYSHDEHTIIAQIFGNDIPNFLEAARFCEAEGFDGIDINMGCPARHVVRSEQGIALRKHHERAFAIVDAVRQAVRIPVSVKTRLGIHDASDLVDFCKGLERAGCSLVTIHGRTYDVPYASPADFEPLYALQRELRIPVIGNGGILSLADGERKRKNLAGVMIGRAALGNPWVFSPEAPPPFSERVPLILQHVSWMIELKGIPRALLEIRKHLIAYAKGVRDAARFRSRLARVQTPQEVSEILFEIASR